MESSQSELETRWASLLQPIKDMTKNWDVDLEAILQKYLSEISNTMVTFDGGITVMNFAEAGLMIQRSTDVYRRKVDYLHSLVFQALEVMNNKKKKLAKDTSNSEGDVEPSYDNQHNDDENDDLEAPAVESHHKTIMTYEQDEDAYQNAEEHLVPLVPPMFLPRGEAEKGQPLVGRNGEVFANRNDFWMNTSVLHLSGTLLLSRHVEPFMLELLHARDNNVAGTAANIMGDAHCDDAANDDGCADNDDDGMEGVAEDCGAADNVETGPDSEQQQQHVLTDDHSEQNNAEMRTGIEVEVKRNCVAAKQSVGAQNAAGVRSKEDEANILAKFYSLLDPYTNDNSSSDSSMQNKPCRPGKTYKLCEDLLKSRKRGGATEKKRKHPVEGDDESSVGTATTTSSDSTAGREMDKQTDKDRYKNLSLEPLYMCFNRNYCTKLHMVKCAEMDRLTMPDFERLYWAEKKRRKNKTRRGGRATDTHSEPDNQAGEAASDENRNIEGIDADVDDVIHTEAGDDDNCADDNNDDDGQELFIPDIPDLETLLGFNRNDGRIIERQNAGGWENDTQAGFVTSYEELVKQLFERCRQNIENCMQEGELHKRVMDWQNKVLPHLQEEELRGPFDIHIYGRQILDLLTLYATRAPGGVVPFSDIVCNRKQYEVCRYLLAALQLANMGNVEVGDNGQTFDKAVDSMTLKLLSTQLISERLAEYQAPSTQQNHQ